MASFCPHLSNLLILNHLVGRPFEVLMGHRRASVQDFPSLAVHPFMVLKDHHHPTFRLDRWLLKALQVDRPSLAFLDRWGHRLPYQVHPFFHLPLGH